MCRSRGENERNWIFSLRSVLDRTSKLWALIGCEDGEQQRLEDFFSSFWLCVVPWSRALDDAVKETHRAPQL